MWSNSVERHIGYKAFDKDLKCRGFQYEIGKTYKHSEAMKMCSKGFHFCKKLESVYNYYPRESHPRICEVIAEHVETEGDKSVTNKITIVREIPKSELNSGNSNSGYSNSGNYNSGNSNSGNSNSGHHNSGNSNSGNYNSGYSNSGHHNSGYSNSGHHNSGYFNSGHHNSGYFNSGHHNSGYFNTTNSKVRLFNQNTDLEFTDKRIQRLLSLNIKPIIRWVNKDQMTDQEKKDNPSHKTTGGFLKKTDRTDYSQLTKEDKEAITSLPGYDDAIFKEITGISLQEETIEVIIKGKKKSITKKKAIEMGLIED